MKKIFKKIQLLSLAGLLGLASSCSDFLEAGPSVDTPEETALSNTSRLQMILTSTDGQHYFNTGGSDRVYGGLNGLQMYVDLGGADIVSHTNMGGIQLEAYRFEPKKPQACGSSREIWSMMYKIINQVNT